MFELEVSRTSVRQPLLVLAPSNTLGVEQVGNGGDVGGDLAPVIVVHAEVITTSGGTVVGLGGVSNGEVVGQENTLLGQGLEVLVRSGGGEVLLTYVSLHSLPRGPMD